MPLNKLSLLAALGLSFAVAQDQAALALHGLGGSTVVLSAADLAKLPQKTIQATDHGTPATFEGVLLTDVLAKVDQPVGEKFHTTAASYYLLVGAKDGYRAVFAWAELDPSFTDKAIYIVYQSGWQAAACQQRAVSTSRAG